jgi:hypothetical protein
VALSLDLKLAQGAVLLGGEIRLRTMLRNDGDASVETASLFDNNTITNYVVSDADDRVVATVNHVTRQILMEKVEPRTAEFRLISLPAGGVETRDDNLCRYRWFDHPGVYFLRSLYRWKDVEITSPPRRLEIVTTPLRAYDQQWSYHYGEKFLLHSSWVAERPDGACELFVRESLRFSPHVINYNPSLGTSPAPFSPRVSFNRTLIAGGGVWVAWLGEGEVTALRTEQGRLTGGPWRYALPLAGLDWASPPLTSDAGDAILLMSGIEAGAGRRVLALKIGSDGVEERRAMVTPGLVGAVTIQGACDDDGGFHLFWLTGDNYEIKHLSIDLAALQSSGGPTTLWRSEHPPIGLLTPPVFTADSFVACMFAKPDPRALRLAIAWLRLDGAGNPLKVEELVVAGPDTVIQCSGEMNDAGHVFALVTTPRAVHYVNGALMQALTLAAPEQLFVEGGVHLTVNQRNDVFFVAGERPFGLTEKLIHRGTDQDLAEAQGTG